MIMRTDRWICNFLLAIFLLGLTASHANAIELNWSGQFWSEFNFIKNYTMDGSDAGANYDPTRAYPVAPAAPAADKTKPPVNPGYYVPAAGSNNASFETLFLRLRPKLVVNDNIYIKSELWAGDPTFGYFGNAYPFSSDQTQFYSNQSRGSFITAQRYWAELLSDFGTIQIGRTPLDWGLGVVWNSGDELFSRYMSTGDSIRLIAKFGAFTFTPAVVVYSIGNNVGGSCLFGGSSICVPAGGSAGVTDYSIALKYENLEEDFDGGVNLIRRIAGPIQDPSSSLGPLGDSPGQIPVNSLYNIWDIYAKKKVGKFTLGGELPIATGTVGGLDYSSFGLAVDADWNMSDTWETRLRLGRAQGQGNAGSATPDNIRMFFFNPNYHVGMIMFNYQLANFAGPNTLNNPTATSSSQRSPFDNPITNANYLSFTGLIKSQKWTIDGAYTVAGALNTAKGSDAYFYNMVARKMVKNLSGKDQDSSLGSEIDVGAAFQWDDYLTFRLDTGLWFPGGFYKFSNTSVDNATDTVWGTIARVGVNF